MLTSRPLISALTLAIGFGLAAVPTAEAATCRAAISGSGNGQGVLGKGTEVARSAATIAFEAKAKTKYGQKYASLSKASNVKWDCKSTALKATCVVTAKPCK